MSSESTYAYDRKEALLTRRRFPIQWNLRTLLLLTATVAVWAGYLSFHHRNETLEQEHVPLRHMARSLMVEDLFQIAVVKLPELWMNEDRWEVYLPEGRYALCLATSEIGETGLAPVEKPVSLLSGRHRIEFHRTRTESKTELSVLVDGGQVIVTGKEPEWHAKSGFTFTAEFEDCAQLPPDKPVILFRGRFTIELDDGSTTLPDTPSDGLLLWIEPRPR